MPVPSFNPGKAARREFARYRRNLKAWAFWWVLLAAIVLAVALFVTAGGHLPKAPGRAGADTTEQAPTMTLPVCDGWSDVTCTPAPTVADAKVDLASRLTRVSGDAKKVTGTNRIPSHCEAGTAGNGAWLPDPACAPGAVATRVTQANIRSTICRPGYTVTVRPPTSATRPVKAKLLAAYGYDPGAVAELDHVVPLTLGGANSVSNLAPQPGPVPNAKDHVEVVLAQSVCAGRVTLAEAQRRIVHDWTSALDGLGTALTTTVAQVDVDTEQGGDD